MTYYPETETTVKNGIMRVTANIKILQGGAAYVIPIFNEIGRTDSATEERLKEIVSAGADFIIEHHKIYPDKHIDDKYRIP